jgi:alpha-1,4-digalacturonate transport system substrate-binding protein
MFGQVSPVAYKLQGYRLNRAIFNAIAQRVTQAIVGEMTVDEALTRISADVDEAVAQSKQ